MQIIKYPNPILTTPCVKVHITQEIIDFVSETIEFMKTGQWWSRPAGLAANQVGKNWRIFILNGEKDESEVFINPEIIWTTRAPKNTRIEGCYSLIDGQYYRTQRSPSLTLKWQDTQGEWSERRYNGLMAEVVQHEMEHLDGNLCIPEDVIKRELEEYNRILEEKRKEMIRKDAIPMETLNK